MSYHYTSVLSSKSDILLRGYRDGKRIQKKIKYKPYLFVETTRRTEWRALDGRYVERMGFENAYEANDFRRRYEGVDGFEVFGMTNWVYPFIYDEFEYPINADFKNVRIGYIDIETLADGAFESPLTARKPLTAITLRHRSKNFIFSYLCDYVVPDENSIFFKAKDEKTMLRKFIEVWQRLDLDIISGWNIEGYDIPYIINRIISLFGIKVAESLSPWGFLDKKKIIMRGVEVEMRFPAGISVIDYLDTYKKYRYKPQESYTLDFICNEELGVGKLEYSQHGSLHQFMLNDPQGYIDYNRIDCERVNELDNKLKYFDLLLTVAYTARINFGDAFATTRPWDAIIHAYLMDRKIVVPLLNPQGISQEIAGGFVKEPQLGKHGWVVSFDVTSLYPHIIMMFNISPETLLTVLSGFNVTSVLGGALNDEKLINKLIEEEANITSSGAVYDNSTVGFYAALMAEYFETRAKFNKIKKQYDKEKEETSDPDEKERLLTLYREYDAKQNALKILLNGAYGSLASPWFRWFDPRLAESITMTGQTIIQLVERALNTKTSEITGIEKDYVIAIDTDSVTGDSLIRTSLGEERIDNFFERTRLNGKVVYDSGDQLVVKPKVKYDALSMTQDGQAVMKNVNYVMAHKVKKKLYRIKVDNKEVTITEDHSVIVKRYGELCSIKPTEIVDGDILITINSNRHEEVSIATNKIEQL